VLSPNTRCTFPSIVVASRISTAHAGHVNSLSLIIVMSTCLPILFAPFFEDAVLRLKVFPPTTQNIKAGKMKRQNSRSNQKSGCTNKID
jgi:hypothetical protein